MLVMLVVGVLQVRWCWVRLEIGCGEVLTLFMDEDGNMRKVPMERCSVVSMIHD
jgi:hypothetical protein|tara:strand:- start:9794 stop:9955 length:162 start_codon:yes stop_codon:yes gene_type:complete